MRRLFRCSVQLVYADGDHEVQVHSFIADRAEYWWHSSSRPDTTGLWDSTIQLGEQFFNEIIRHPIPLDLHTLKALKRSPLGLDIYFWLVYRTFALSAPLTLSWRQLFRQFGADPAKATKPGSVSRFPRGGLARAEKNQNRVARLELPHGDGWARRLALDPTYHAHTAPVDRRVVDRRPSRPPRAGRVPRPAIFAV